MVGTLGTRGSPGRAVMEKGKMVNSGKERTVEKETRRVKQKEKASREAVGRVANVDTRLGIAQATVTT